MISITTRFLMVILLALIVSFLVVVSISFLVDDRLLAPDLVRSLGLVSESVKEIDALASQDIDHRTEYPISLERFTDRQDLERWLTSNQPSQYDHEFVIRTEPDDYVAIALNRETLATSVRTEDNFLLIAAGIVLSIFACSSLLLSWPLVRALRQQELTIRLLAEGDLTARTNITGPAILQKLGLRINQMANRIQGLLQSNEELFQSVSHEMRTPISRIHFSLELLEQDLGIAGNSRIQSMKQDVEELDRLLEELLSFARLGNDRKELPPEPVSMKELVQSVLERTEIDFPNSHWKFDAPEGLAFVDADPRLLNRAVENVIRNAHAYCKSEVFAELKVEPHQIVLSVEDDGPGVPPDDQARIFEPFARVEGNQNKGTGLGLAIARRIVEKHQGTIACSAGPVGARFRITLPASSMT